MSLPLKWQIQLWHTLLLVVLLTVLGALFYHYEKARRLENIDRQLDMLIHPVIGPFTPRGRQGRSTRQFSEQIGKHDPEPDILPGGWIRFQKFPSTSSSQKTDIDIANHDMDHRKFDENYVPKGYYAILTQKREPFQEYASSNIPEETRLPEVSAIGYYYRFHKGNVREIYYENRSFRVLVGMSLKTYHRDLTRLKIQITGSLLLLGLVTVPVGLKRVSVSLHTLKEIHQTADRIAVSDLSARIPAPTPRSARELRDMGHSLNHTFAQLESLFQRQIRFTADASHELRTPLTALVAQIELGLEAPKSMEEIQHILQVCQRSAGRIQKITEQLIELSRYDSGRAALSKQETGLHHLAESLAAELWPYMKEHRCELRTDLQEVTLLCDPFKVEQVLMNLIQNAVEHNEDPVQVLLRIRREESLAVIEVIDNGRGIASENLGNLFNRFYQEHTSPTRFSPHPHVGLGLSISEAIVKAHGGSISVESQTGIRTAFILRIPLA